MSSGFNLSCLLLTFLVVSTTAAQFKFTLRSAPLNKVYLKARVGKVEISVTKKDGSVEKVAEDDLRMTLDSKHEFNFEFDGKLSDMEGVGVTWKPSSESSSDRLYPLGFKVSNVQTGNSMRLCRRKASDGIVPNGTYVFKRSPQCYRDHDQSPPKEEN